jgi:hypothetical protein
MDVATILLSGDNSRSGMSWQDIPTTLAKHLAELRQAQTTFIFEIRVDADNARLACTRFG